MDYKFLYKNLLNIIFRPSKAWEIITSENKPVRYLRNNFLFPLIALVVVAVFIGSIIFTNKNLPPLYSVIVAVKYFFLLLLVVFTSALFLGETTKPLDLGKDFTISFRLIVYSLTPLFICLTVSHIFESLIFINILALYGFYIFWSGANKMLNPPDYKKMPLLIATFIITTGIFVAGDIVLSSIFDRIYYNFLV
jgi:hypothetical protein